MPVNEWMLNQPTDLSQVKGASHDAALLKIVIELLLPCALETQFTWAMRHLAPAKAADVGFD
jgi:hypothetical protein